MYSEEEAQRIKDQIIDKVEIGQSLLEISKNENMICQDMIYKWLNKDAQFKENYVRAKRYQSLFVWERINGVIHNLKLYGKALTNEQVQLARLEIDSDKWYVSKLVPKIFGTAADITNVQINLNQITGMSITNEGKVRDIADKAVKLLADQDQ